ncbi:MAG: hypothetical protein WBX25_23320, partial [Rhodomicrobium sp.]
DDSPIKLKRLLDQIHSVLNDKDFALLSRGKDGNPSFDPNDSGKNNYCDIRKNEGCAFIYENPIRESVVNLFLNSLQGYGNAFASYIKTFKPSKPIDSLTHTVIFMVTYGAGVSPNWTLIGLTTANSPLANAQGQRTHNLLITIGPDTENTANLATQQVVNVLNQPR